MVYSKSCEVIRLDCQKIGTLIYELRKEKNMTQKQLADVMNISDINFQFKRSITLTPIDNHSVYVFLEINKPIDDGSFNMKTVMQKSYIINSEKLVAFMSGRF